jgi:hypothetical protein
MGQLYFSPGIVGFFDSEIAGEDIPADAVAITAQRHAELMAGQTAGRIIVAGEDGLPRLAEAPTPDLEFLRARANLPKFEFLRQCVLAGLLTEADALSAARGDIPAAFAQVVAGWSEAERFEAELRWASLSQVDRMHPLIIAVADQAGITVEQLDLLFGISAVA